MTYKDLDVYKDALALFYECHRLSKRLPKHELYEQGSQLRRAADSVISNLVEGYGRRRYRADYVRFLICSHASLLEVQCHLEKIAHIHKEVSSECTAVLFKYDLLGRKMHGFIKHVEMHWNA